MANPTLTNVTYAGEHAGQYISAAFLEAKSLDFLTSYENIKYKRAISVFGLHQSSDGLIKNASCDFNSQGTTELTDKILEPKLLEVNLQLCKNDVLADWQAAQMKAGAHNSDFSSDFTSFVFSYVAGTIAQGVENNIWTGAGGTAGQFEGFLTATTGAFAVDGNVTAVAKTGAFDATTIIANIELALTNVPNVVYGKDDLYLYMNTVSYRYYIDAISKLGYLNAYNMQGDYIPMANGVKIAVCPGMPNDTIVAARKSNLMFGTDLISDQTEVKMLDMSALDGSDNIRLVAKFSGGTQVGIGAEVIHLS